MKILIIDYGMGNLGSVKRAFEECGVKVVVSTDPAEADDADALVLPGVGAFRDGMASLVESGWAPRLKSLAQENKPLLGICLGMQLLATRSFEGGEFEGLGLIPGEVVKLIPQQQNERVPHVGWNEVVHDSNHSLFSEIVSGTDFYFVHSFHFKPVNETDAIATTPYCGSFVSAVARQNILGVQFHPEKSSKPGFKLIKNFLSMI